MDTIESPSLLPAWTTVVPLASLDATPAFIQLRQEWLLG